MARKRLDDTEALRRPALREGHFSRSVEKVSMGHIVSESHYGPDGPGYSTKEFVPAGERGVGKSSLRDAMDCAKGK